jgi:hypothetical protein
MRRKGYSRVAKKHADAAAVGTLFFSSAFEEFFRSDVENPDRLNQISRPGYRRAPGHRQARTVPPRILMKCFINYDRAADYDRHSQSCFEHCVHAELLRDEAPTRSYRFGSEP